MKINKFILSPLILLFSLNLFAQMNSKVKVVGIVDGDTITVLDKDKRQTAIRIVGIDAPEKDQTYGDVARRQLSTLIYDKNILIVYVKSDEKNRQTVGKVTLDGKDIGLELLRTGNAWYFKEQDSLLDSGEQASYISAESEARKIRTGLWQNDSPESPWSFKDRILAETRAQILTSFSTTKGINSRVTEIINGISFAVMKSDNSRLVICVNNLEVPEPGQPLSNIAEQHLRDLLINKIVLINIKGFTEENGCLTADVYLNEININLQMVRDGIAWTNKEYYYPEGYYTYQQAENAARTEKRGIWQSDSPVPPWVYREQFYKNGGTGSISSFGGGGNASSNSGAGKTVYVRGYTRRDGTYVSPYTRSAPNTRSGGGRRRN